MLYALFLVLVVILGRTGRTEFSFPATAIGTLVNIGLNVALIPAYGIVGAGIALVASYSVILIVMYVVTQRLFRVPYEWPRLAQAAGLAAALVAIGELALPTEGFAGLVERSALWLAYPAILYLTGFLNDEERRAAANNLTPSAISASIRKLSESSPEEGEQPEPDAAGRGPRLTREALEAEQRDEDARGPS
jgi:hypothetical protein